MSENYDVMAKNNIFNTKNSSEILGPIFKSFCHLCYYRVVFILKRLNFYYHLHKTCDFFIPNIKIQTFYLCFA